MSKNRKLITILLTFFMCFALSFSAFEIFAKDFNFNVKETVEEEKVAQAASGKWSDYASIPVSSGNTYYITTGSELAWIAKNASSTSGKTFLIMNEISLSAHYWYFTDTFYGTINGNNDSMQRITGLTINYYDSTSPYAGLFGKAEGATIKNIYVEGSVYYRTSYAGTNAYIGGIAGYAHNTIIKNVISNVSVDYKNNSHYAVDAGESVYVRCWIGGVTGVSIVESTTEALISNVIVFNKLKADLAFTTDIGSWILGLNKGSFTIYSGIGGVSGGVLFRTGGGTVVKDCCSYIDIDSNFMNNGGIIGFIETSGSGTSFNYNIERCVYGGTLKVTTTSDEESGGVTKYTGGIVGKIDPKSSNTANLITKYCISYMSMGSGSSSSNIIYKSVCGNYSQSSVNVTSYYCYGFNNLSGVIWGESTSETANIGVTTIAATNSSYYATSGKLKNIKYYDLFKGEWAFADNPIDQTGWFLPKETNYKNLVSGFAESTTMGRFSILPCLNLFYFCGVVKTQHAGNNDLENITMKSENIELSFSYEDCLGSSVTSTNTISSLNSTTYGAVDTKKINKDSIFRFCIPVTAKYLQLNWGTSLNSSKIYYNEGDLDTENRSYNSEFVKLNYLKSTGDENTSSTVTYLYNSNFNTKEINTFTFIFNYRNVDFNLRTYHIDADKITANKTFFDTYLTSEKTIDFSNKNMLKAYIDGQSGVISATSPSSNVLKLVSLKIDEVNSSATGGIASFSNRNFKMATTGDHKGIKIFCDIPYGYDLEGVYFKNKLGVYTNLPIITSGSTEGLTTYLYKSEVTEDLDKTEFDGGYTTKLTLKCTGGIEETNTILNKLYGFDITDADTYNAKGMGINGTVNFYMLIVPKLIKIKASDESVSTSVNEINFLQYIKEGYGENINKKFRLFDDVDITDLNLIKKDNITSFNNNYFNHIELNTTGKLVDSSATEDTSASCFYNEDFLSNIFVKLKQDANNHSNYIYDGLFTYYGSKLTIPIDNNFVISENGYTFWGIKIFYNNKVTISDNEGYDLNLNRELSSGENVLVLDKNMFSEQEISGTNIESNNINSLEIFLVYKVKKYRAINYVFSNSSESDVYKNSSVGGNAGEAESSWWRILKEGATPDAEGSYKDTDYIYGITEEILYYYHQPIQIKDNKNNVTNSNYNDIDHVINVVYDAKKGYSFNRIFFVNKSSDKISDFTFNLEDLNKINYSGAPGGNILNNFTSYYAPDASEEDKKNSVKYFVPDDTCEEIELVVAFSVAEYEATISMIQKSGNQIFDSSEINNYEIQGNCGFNILVNQLLDTNQPYISYYPSLNNYNVFILSKNLNKWKVSYSSNPSAVFEKGDLEHGILYGAEITLCIRLVDGYNFLGWYMYDGKDESGKYLNEKLISTEPYYVFKQGVKENKIYALYEKNYLHSTNSSSELNMSNNVINLNTKQDFIGFAKKMKTETFQGKVVSLNTSIDFTNENFEVLGVNYITTVTTSSDYHTNLEFKIEYTPFKGVFYGNGNTLFNINSTNYFTPIDGVFGVVQGGTINNLNVANSKFAYKQVYYDNFSVDELSYDKYVDLSYDNNFRFTYTIKSSANIFEGNGAIVGYAKNCQINGCFVKDVKFSQVIERRQDDGTYVEAESIEKSNIIYSNNVGGIIGYSFSNLLSRCYVDATVIGGNNVGGIIGYENAATKISECYVTGTIGDSFSANSRALVGYSDGLIEVSDIDIEVNIAYFVPEGTPALENNPQNALDSICYNITDDNITNLQYSINVNKITEPFSKVLSISEEDLESSLWKLYNEKYVLSYFYWYVFD